MTSDYMISYFQEQLGILSTLFNAQLLFPSNLNNQLGFVVAKQDESENESVSNSSLFLVFDLYLLYNIMWDKSYKERSLFGDIT